MTTDAVARLSQTHARLEELREQQEAIRAEQARLSDDSMILANEVVRSWGPNATVEQLLSLGGCDAAREIVEARVAAKARGYRIQRSGFSVRTEKDRYIPTGFAFEAFVDPTTDTADLAGALVGIAEEFRGGREEVAIQINYREGGDLNAGLANGKTQHHLVIADAEHAEVISSGRFDKEVVVSSGTPAGALAKAIELSYSDSLPW